MAEGCGEGGDGFDTRPPRSRERGKQRAREISRAIAAFPVSCAAHRGKSLCIIYVFSSLNYLIDPRAQREQLASRGNAI
jgi:hypothetical protein